MRRFALFCLLTCLLTCPISGCSSGSGEGGGSVDTAAPADAGSLPEPECERDDQCADLAADPCKEAVCDAERGECVVRVVVGCFACDEDGDCAALETQLCKADGADCGPCTAPACVDGVCAVGVADDGAACDDGDACTQTDTCQAGVCTGEEPVVCEASDSCHAVGVCDPTSGVCSDPALDDGTACDDGDACTQTDTCQAGVCTGEEPVVCEASDSCHAVGVCDPTSGVCSDPIVDDGTACDDGDACTQTDTCQAGVCTGDEPVVCEASDGCHAVGVCDPTSGVCSDPIVDDGTGCDDGDACTQTDTCQAGVCTGEEPVVCEASDSCHAVGVCDPTSGICSNPIVDDGTDCDDGDDCTQTDTCQAGVCTGAEPVVCEASDSCHAVGVCDPTSGICSNPIVDDGTDCDDGDDCTQTDTCQAGACTGAEPVVCEASDSCHAVGVCDPTSGVCSDPIVDDGTACDDGDACTQTDTCQAGVCTGREPVVCQASDSCHAVGVCDPASGVCSDPVVDDGTACDDGDACTRADTCQAGVCVGDDPVVCEAVDACHLVGVCDPTSGVCSAHIVEDGTACDDGDACTRADTCQAGVCVGDDPVVCEAVDACHLVGVCDPTSGVCSAHIVDDGTDCDDGDACTQVDTCLAGLCVGANPIDCADANPCTTDACAAGACLNTPLPGCIPELVCDDALDDNGDGWVDCDDPHCAAAERCLERPLGDLCVDPFLVNDGAPVDASLVGQALNYPGNLTSAGDTLDFRLDYWPTAVPEDDALVRDAVYRLALAEPLVVTITLDFDGDDPTVLPWAAIGVFTDSCHPQNQIDAADGEDDAEDRAVLTRTFTAGTYYLVATGARTPENDWATYQIDFAFAALPATETVCDDALDDDADGATDCADPDCGADPLCPDCPVAAALACGNTISGVLAGHSEDGFYLYYSFSVAETTNVMVTKARAEDYTDQLQINYGDDWFEPFAGDCYGDQPSGLWHGGDNDYFTAQPGRTYGLKVFITDSTYDDGDYSFTIYCDDGGPESACDDDADDDADGFVDCEDPDCFDDVCSGGESGETCAVARPVNGGHAIATADLVGEGEDARLSFTYWNTTSGRADDLAADCLPASALGPDVVYRFELTDTLAVTAEADAGFFDPPFTAPGLYLFSTQCAADGLRGCGATYSFGGFDLGFAILNDVLPPGQYFLVVDSGATGADGVPDAGAFQLDLDFRPPPVPEDCGNGVDDDADGAVDCLDTECFGEMLCTDGHAGEDCADPYEVNGGAPLVLDEVIELAQSTVGRVNDLSGACSYYSWFGPDVVYAFTLDAPAVVTANAAFDNGLPAALYLLDAACDQANQLACASGEDTVDQSATVEVPLEPGTYHLVIDAGANIMGYNSGPFSLTLMATAPPEEPTEPRR